MKMIPIVVLVGLFVSHNASAEQLLVSIDGMNCISCQPKLEGAFQTVQGVASVQASTSDGVVCVETEGEGHPDAGVFQASLAEYPEYTVTQVAVIDTCPFLQPQRQGRGRLWRDTAGLDVIVISRGEEVELASAIVSGKFTIIDFGAQWCGPCLVAEKKLKTYLSTYSDVAVRAVAMGGTRPEDTFALAVARQHLSNVPGVPHFVVFGPDGRQVYKGGSVDKALSTIDKKRAP